MVARQGERYRKDRQIGSGGMSVVYKGTDTALDRDVAIKVLHPHLNEKEDSRRRFNREARAVAKLHHPNILEIFDFSGEDERESFIVTEFIDGWTLRAFAEEHAFEPPEIAAMAVHELAGALEHAHASGIIHRDLKPENVMIRKDGVLKLMDFGIAKVIDRDERMTMTGALVGSPAHMAPEIIEGQEAAQPADIFSLGTILYWLCCRELPFVGNNTTQTLKLVLDGQYMDPRSRNPAVSDELAAVIARCLARDPAGRYPSAGELRQALAEVLQVCKVERVGEELVKFFQDPTGFRQGFKKALVAHLLVEAGASARGPERSYARTIKWLNRVLALDAQNAEAQSLLALTRTKDRRKKALTDLGKGATALAALVALCAAGYQGFVAWRTQRHVSVVEPAPLKPLGDPVVAPAPLPKPVEPRPAEPEPKIAEPVRPKIEPKLLPKLDPKKAAKPVEVAKADKPAAPAEPVEQREVELNLAPAIMTAAIRVDDQPELKKGVASWKVPLGVGKHVAHVQCPACLDEPYAFEVRSFKDEVHLRPVTFNLRYAAQVTAELEDPAAVVRVNGQVMAAITGEPKRRRLQFLLPDGSSSAKVLVEILSGGKPTQSWDQTLVAGRENVLRGPGQ